MVNQAAIQGHINYGYQQAAKRLGATYTQFRCATYDIPLSPENQIGTIFVAFDAKAAFPFNAPTKTSTDIYFGLMDLTNVLSGDYLQGPQGTFFVSEIEPLRPPVCIRCAATFTFSRGPALVPGLHPMREFNGAQDTYFAKQIPASIAVDRERGGKPLTNLPDDVISRLTFKALISPAFAAGQPDALLPSDTVTDEVGQRYQVYEALWHPTGWQIRLERL